MLNHVDQNASNQKQVILLSYHMLYTKIPLCSPILPFYLILPPLGQNPERNPAYMCELLRIIVTTIGGEYLNSSWLLILIFGIN